MKKVFLVFMSLMFIMCLAGCGENQEKINIDFIIDGKSHLVEINKGTSIGKDIIPLSNDEEIIELYYDENMENEYDGKVLNEDCKIYIKALKGNPDILDEDENNNFEEPIISSIILKIDELNHKNYYLKEYSDLISFLKNYDKIQLITNINECHKTLLDIFNLEFFELYDLGVFSIKKNDSITSLYDKIVISNYIKVENVLEFNLKRFYSNIVISPEIKENELCTYVYFIIIPKCMTLDISTININLK